MHLTSRQNARIKQVHALRRKKEREASGLFLVEGLRHVGEAAEFGAQIEFVLHTPGITSIDYTQTLLALLAEKRVQVFTTDDDIYASVAEKEGRDGILAVVRQTTRGLDDLDPHSAPFLCAVARPQDPGNLGTLLRTVDAAGAAGLILLGQTVDPFHPTAARASMGTLFRLPPVRADLADFQTWSNAQGYQIVGASAAGAVDYRTANYTFPLVLLLGSEREGLNEAERAICDVLVKLPMRGAATSLNLAVAGGILLYHLADQFEA